MSIDTEKTDFQGQPRGNCFREDNDYALAWVRRYGRGRVFYSTIAHNPYVFWDPKMLRFYLAAAQFALGDLPAPTIPSAKLTPAIRAQEKLGWRLGIEAYTFHKYTLFEAIDKTAQLGLPYMGGLSFQKVSKEIPKNFDDKLTEDELKQIRLKLDSAGVRLLTYYIHLIPGDEAGCRKVFEFGRKIGIETFMSEPIPEALDTIEKFCDDYDINVAIHNHDRKASPQYWRPEGVLKVCQGRSKRIGACGDLGYWMRSGIDPIKAVNILKNRLITVQMHDLHELNPDGHDVPWGTGVGKTEQFIREIHRLGIRPTMFGLEYSYNWFESMPEIAKCIEFFNRVSLQIAQRDKT
jgi:sugar phosphate isomerase/epimerase